MKLKLNKSKIKNLSNSQPLNQFATPLIAGGRRGGGETEYDRGCPFFTDRQAKTCGMGWTCDGVN
ncbi:hypothetical protein A7985_04045 [Pseudoalteromonas luteoviolacea]|uniref:Uncharacterized protein n=1 Tax=Pseudoalteromonas luteoviolacea TaxID=43657 RepID=A0A1C0TUX5_9GAMM|nr:hypothetical protein [Pseudoalteromonas luteoviolacea]MBQ4812433.1 hypothetical protein [Pseudoalteromonas luteoviolacea]OCQ23130.1 hypothetical protein A7985_04045 [Pseudoalteromonas luteoviolacea]